MDDQASLRGHFITIEGGEGVGKSTQSQLLVDYLKSCEIDAVLTREPGGSEGADQIRQLLVSGPEDRWDSFSETLLLFAARRDHISRTISPALKAGIWVVCDRFYDSTIAYQGFGHGVDLGFLELLNERATLGLKPDITFILDAPSEVGVERALRRGGTETRYERLVADFHARARRGFIEVARLHPHRCRLLDVSLGIAATRAEIEREVAINFLPKTKYSDRSVR